MNSDEFMIGMLNKYRIRYTYKVEVHMIKSVYILSQIGQVTIGYIYFFIFRNSHAFQQAYGDNSKKLF